MILHIFFQELVASNPSVYNWKGIIIALVVISQVIGLVIIAVYLMTPPASLLELDGERMQREDVEKEDFRNRICNGTWISGRMKLNGCVFTELIVRRGVSLPEY